MGIIMKGNSDHLPTKRTPWLKRILSGEVSSGADATGRKGDDDASSGSELLEDFPSKPTLRPQTANSDDDNDDADDDEVDADVNADIDEDGEEDADINNSASDATDGSALLQDFPTLPRLASFVRRANAVSTPTAAPTNNDDVGPRSTRLRGILVERNVARPHRSRNRVRIVEELSTVHHYYKPRTQKYLDILYISKADRRAITRRTLQLVLDMKQSFHTLEAETSAQNNQTGNSTAATVNGNVRNEEPSIRQSIEDKIDSLISDLLPSPSSIPPDCVPEEIIGVDHLLAQSRVVMTLNGLRKRHIHSVVDFSRRFEHDDEELGNVSRKISYISSRIAFARAAFAASLED
mmetsp:Transcript_8144/g.17332  ORF Transcript_8144/g.17332 Transcript_8144/m.17332 type:complete len:350 (-) Transcript_8144:78-1127(-)